MLRHGAIDLPRQLDEARFEADLLDLPREVERVDGNAVAPEAGTRIERHEAKWLRGCGLYDFPDTDAQPIAHHGQLVDHADVHGAERVLEQLHHLRYFGRTHFHHGVDGRTVQRCGEPRAIGREAADHLRHVLG